MSSFSSPSLPSFILEGSTCINAYTRPPSNHPSTHLYIFSFVPCLSQQQNLRLHPPRPLDLPSPPPHSYLHPTQQHYLHLFRHPSPLSSRSPRSPLLLLLPRFRPLHRPLNYGSQNLLRSSHHHLDFLALLAHLRQHHRYLQRSRTWNGKLGYRHGWE